VARTLSGAGRNFYVLALALRTFADFIAIRE